MGSTPTPSAREGKTRMELTREQILEMLAGEELDILVGKEVMGWKTEDRHSTVFFPSTSISDAWWIVDKVSKEGFFMELCTVNYRHHESKEMEYRCEILDFRNARAAIVDGVYQFVNDPPQHWQFIAHAKEAPLAICRAALLMCLEAGK